MNPINTIGIIAESRKTGVLETLKTLISFLQHQHKTLILNDRTAALLPHTPLPVKRSQELGKECDLIIVVGGDGSLLRASHDVVDSNVPVLGINRGNVGFLTDINPQELGIALNQIFAGHYHEEQRFLLDIEVQDEASNTLTQDHVLNEVILLPNANPHMIDFEIYIDDVFVCRERSDGLIVATPTGSTAYALSGGGPILHPELNAIALVPMFPHTLSSRPIVIEASHTIRVDVLAANTSTPRISCDGQSCTDVPISGSLIIKKKTTPLRLIHPIDYDYYSALRSKLHWGKKHYHED